MPSQAVLAARLASADPFAPSAALVADAGACAAKLARIWPRPHAGYFNAEPARRHLARVVVERARVDAADLAEPLAFWSARRVIATFLPGAPAGLAEALRKLAGDGWRSEHYGSLFALLEEGGEGAKVLRHATAIEPRFLAMLRALPAPLRRVRIAALTQTLQLAALLARGAKRACGGDAKALARLADRLERARSETGLFRMMIDEIGLDQLAPPPVPATDWLRSLATTASISNAALRFENCLKGRMPMLLLGKAAYYEVVGDEPAIVEIVRDMNGLWVVGEIRGHANVDISDGLWSRIRAHLEAHGARLGGARPDALAVALAQAAGW